MSAFAEVLREASSARRAVGAFTAYNLETADACVRCAAQTGRDMVVLVSPAAYAGPTGDRLLAMLLAVARTVTTSRVLVQLDHVRDLDLIERALRAGVHAVMADGSRMPFDENVRFTAEAVRLAAEFGAGVEAELGHVAGDEDVATAAAAGALTDPDEAARFVDATGVACLAVSIGNVHGRYRTPPQLDWDRLDAIRAITDVPLALHGASGLSDRDTRRSIDHGVAKVNVNTELRERYVEVLDAALPDVRRGADLLGLSHRLGDAVHEVVSSKVSLFEGGAAA